MTTRNLYILATVALTLIASGCEELPSDPTPSQQIVGDWKSSKVGAAFTPASSMEFNFKASGDVTVIIDALTFMGTYTTIGSSFSVDVREINITINGRGSFTGIYQITGSQMKLELVPDPVPAGTAAPTPMEGIGSTTIGGVKTTTYVTELQRK